MSPRIVNHGGYMMTALLPYRHPLVRAFIVEAKYHDNKHAQTLLGSILAAYLANARDCTTLLSDDLVIVPIPLGSKRRKERGYNQVERIAEAARQTYPYIGIETGFLQRARETLPQTSLTKNERILNIQGAFSASGPIQAHSTYIILDDVITTGSTLRCALDAIACHTGTRPHGLALAY